MFFFAVVFLAVVVFFAGIFFSQLRAQGLQIFRVPAAGLQLPVYRDDIAAGRGDEILLFCGERGAAAQCLHQRCLLRHGTAKARRVQVDDAAR